MGPQTEDNKHWPQIEKEGTRRVRPTTPFKDQGSQRERVGWAAKRQTRMVGNGKKSGEAKKQLGRRGTRKSEEVHLSAQKQMM